MNPAERAKQLEGDNTLEQAHGSAAEGGQTAAPTAGEECALHFVSFIHHEGKLYEMDGRKPVPHCHGETTPETFLVDTGNVVKNVFMARDPDQMNFSAVALCPEE